MSTSIVLHTVLATVVLAGSGACATEPPAPPADPTTAAFDHEVRFACGAWLTGKPTATWGLFDLYLGSDSTSLLNPPTERERSIVRDAGGIVVYEFSVPVIRALLPIADVPVRPHLGIGVTDASVFPVDVFVTWATTDSTSNARTFEAIGGVIHRAGFSSSSGLWFVGAVPDDAIATLRADPGVVWVQPEGAICVAPRD